MSTAAVSTPPTAVPTTDEAFAHARGAIHRAAADLWPGAEARLDRHVPSVTGYVQRLHIDDRELYAKYSFLGMSLVSLLRGAGGDWAEVQRAQSTYVRATDALLEREAAQLRLLGELGRPQVCQIAGVGGGVLFTEPVAGTTLDQLLLQNPADSPALFERVFTELHRLHISRTAERLAASRTIAERSVAGTFQRKFNGISGQTYLGRLGTERCTPDERAEVTALLRAVVARLLRIRPTALAPGQAVLTYGDLKPEHLVFPTPDARPVLIDPGLLRARSSADAAKLISRTILLIAAQQPDPATAHTIADGIGAFTEQRMTAMAPKAARSWLREVLILWLMDTVNILTTYLSAPAALPLPERGHALVDRAVTVATLAHSISAELLGGRDTTTVWHTALAQAKAARA